jgi:hypothetical protein
MSWCIMLMLPIRHTLADSQSIDILQVMITCHKSTDISLYHSKKAHHSTI